MAIINFKRHRVKNLKISYRALCMTCNYKGHWRDIMNEAEEDARGHKAANPSHKLEIEIEQKLSMFARTGL